MKKILSLLKYTSHVLALAAGCFLLGAGSTACSEKKAPDVPEEQSNLLFDTLTELEQGKYETALPKLRKYREIDSTNVLIERMISQTVTNTYVVQLRHLLEQGKFAEAEALMKSMLAQHDSLEDRVQMSEFTSRLNEVDQLIAKLAPVQDSETLRDNAERLLERSRNLPAARTVILYARRKIRAADELAKIENDRKVIWPWLDALEARRNGDLERAELLRIFISAQFPDGFGEPIVRDMATGN